MKDANRKNRGSAPKKEADAPQPLRIDDDPDRHLIRLQLAKPPDERTNFLRIPLANGGSCI